MTALELLDLLESDPDGAWTDVEMERLSGIAAAGDVDPTLARQFVYGRLLLKAAGVDFSEGRTLSAARSASVSRSVRVLPMFAGPRAQE